MGIRTEPPTVSLDVLRAQAGYHRILFVLAFVLLCLCFLLPTPDQGGQVRLPWLDRPLPLLCTLKREFGIDCPGCGLTRCFLSMSHGQVAAAWHYHPVGVLLFTALIFQIPYRLCQLWRIHRGYPELTHWTLQSVPLVLVAAILGQWILRITGALVA